MGIACEFVTGARAYEKSKGQRPVYLCDRLTSDRKRTLGQITKWTGVSGSTTYTVGDSIITEDKFGKVGKVGISTRPPTLPVTVAGMIETVLNVVCPVTVDWTSAAA